MVIDPTTLVPVAAYAVLYALLVLRRRRIGGQIDWPRAAAYALGLVAIVVALDSKLDALADAGSMTAHMVQHELLGNVAPVLLLLGLDAALARPVTSEVFGPMIRRPARRRALRAANSPVLAVGLYVGVMWLWYVPTVYKHVSASPVLHPLGHVLFIATGLLFWFHVLRPLPALVTLTPWQKLAYLLAGTLGGAIVAAVLVGAPHALYGATLENQRLAGAVMMGVEMPLALGVALWVFLRAVPRGALRIAAEPAVGTAQPVSSPGR
jgi:putative membrane protein